MEWSRVKSILICVFLVVNLFLFVTYLSNDSGQEVDEATINNVIEILSSNKITMDKKLVEKSNVSIEGIEIKNDLKSASDVVKLSFPDGRNIKTTDDDFSCEIKASGVSSLSERKVKSVVKKEMKNRHLLCDVNYIITIAVQSDGTYDVTYMPEFKGKQVVDISLTANVNKDGTIRFYGYNWLLDSFESSDTVAASVPLTDVLINFANDEDVKKATPLTVTNIDMMYYTGSRNGEISTVTALPVWQISTDVGKVFNYDIRNGQRVN